jgi:benzylsuccinate CoA-transferase BbsF subunit
MGNASLPLSGIRIIETSDILALPMAMSILGDMGAEIIHVEYAQRPNFYRFLGPFPDGDPGINWHDRSGAFNGSNRSKKSFTLNLSEDSGRELFKELVSISDVVAENFSARVMTNLGLNYESLKLVKPDIIMLSNSGYGHTGPWKDYVGMAQVIEAATTSHLTGFPDRTPSKAGQSIMDLVVAWNIVSAISMALFHRNKTGQGQWIDHSMLEACVPMVSSHLLDVAYNNHYSPRKGNRHNVFAPQGCYPCSGDDEWFVLSIQSDDEWAKFSALLGDKDLLLDKYSTCENRMNNHESIDEIITNWSKSISKFEIVEKLQSLNISAAPVNNSRDLLTNSQYKHRNFFEKIEHHEDTNIGQRIYSGLPFQMSKTDGFIQSPTAPLGYHNIYVLSDLLGLKEDDILDLEDDGIVSEYKNGTEVQDMRVGNMPAGYKPASPSNEALIDRGDVRENDLEYKKYIEDF